MTMRWTAPILAGLILIGTVPMVFAVDPIPESEQGPLALRLLDAYRQTHSNTIGRRGDLP